MSAATTTTRQAGLSGTEGPPAPCWMPATDGRTHLVPTPDGIRSGHAVCGALVEIRSVNVGTTVCLGCRAAALADSDEMPSVPRCEARRYRRRLHARHRWLVTRCRLAGGAR
jgi:hypothetical protein